jgi:hypothetical protein
MGRTAKQRRTSVLPTPWAAQFLVVLGSLAGVHLIDSGRAQKRLGGGNESDSEGADDHVVVGE